MNEGGVVMQDDTAVEVTLGLLDAVLKSNKEFNKLCARIAKLEAVAQAAKDVISAVELVPGYVVPKISMQRLQQALAALEEE